MRKLLVILILLVAVVGIADRALLYGAESELGKRVSQQYPMDAEPEVDIGGFPFLNQALTGEYSEISMVTGSFTYEDIQFERVDVTLHDVDAPLSDMLSSPTAVAGQAEGTALLPYSELQRRLPEGMAIEQEGGEPRLAGDLPVQEFSIPVESGIEISVDDSVLTVTPTDIEVGDAAIDTSGVEDQLAFSFPLDGLPFDLQISEVEALPNGVEISVEGSNIPITG